MRGNGRVTGENAKLTKSPIGERGDERKEWETQRTSHGHLAKRGTNRAREGRGVLQIQKEKASGERS